MSNIHSILAVFAGGPHTAARIALARQMVAAFSPQTVVMLGREFTTAHVDATGSLHVADTTRVITDPSTTTLQSCLTVRSIIAKQAHSHIRLVAVTSNYHAARVRWLLQSILPRNTSLLMQSSPDIAPHDLYSGHTARKLIRGEVLSWCYCLPVGLFFRITRMLMPTADTSSARTIN